MEIEKDDEDSVLKVYTSDITKTINWFIYFCLQRSETFKNKELLGSFSRFNNINQNILSEWKKSKTFLFTYDENDKLMKVTFTILDNYRIKTSKNNHIIINI